MSAAESVGTAPEIRAIENKAQGSSFYVAMKLMAKPEREAMFAIYAFCRAVDDIADDGMGTRGERHAALDGWRADLESLYAGGAPGRAAFLAHAVKRYGLRKQDFLAARIELQEAVRLKPDFVFAHYNLGLAHRALGDGKSARQEFERTLAIDPQFTAAQSALGRLPP
jgi:tetratricopeptide (TPR) repeat protein